MPRIYDGSLEEFFEEHGDEIAKIGLQFEDPEKGGPWRGINEPPDAAGGWVFIATEDSIEDDPEGRYYVFDIDEYREWIDVERLIDAYPVEDADVEYWYH